MGDIGRIRKELKILITNLSKMYIIYDQKQQDKEREAKLNAKQNAQKLLDQPNPEGANAEPAAATRQASDSPTRETQREFGPMPREHYQSTAGEAHDGCLNQVASNIEQKAIYVTFVGGEKVPGSSSYELKKGFESSQIKEQAVDDADDAVIDL